MPAPHHSVFLQAGWLPAVQPTASKHWRQPFWKRTSGITDVDRCHTQQHLHSAASHQLTVPLHRRVTYDGRAFTVTGPSTWNSLLKCLCDKTFLVSEYMSQMLQQGCAIYPCCTLHYITNTITCTLHTRKPAHLKSTLFLKYLSNFSCPFKNRKQTNLNMPRLWPMLNLMGLAYFSKN